MERSKRTRQMERWLSTSHWWILVRALAGALVVAAVINLFYGAVIYALGEVIIAGVLFALYRQSVRKIERVIGAKQDAEIEA